jgi:epoxyqueuosine reductase
MEVEWTPDLERRMQDLALDAGFDLARVASADSGQTESSERFTAWIESGHAGEMDYLKRRNDQGVLLRSSLKTAIPWAQSILVCALNYNAQAPRSIDPAPSSTGWIARYAWSGKVTDTEGLIPTDYHDDLLTRLRKIEAGLHQQAACETRCYVDTGPILERNFAATAGIGWIGKNTCVINQLTGSWLLLGVIVTSLPLTGTVEIAADRCGSCTRCIDACPTDALIAPRQMDASRCIAYLTIEKKGDIPEDLREPIGRQVFGCDICQDVCPWNRKAPIALKQGIEPRPELINPTLNWLSELDQVSFKKNFKGSPLERTKRKRLHRNVAIAMGNSRDPQCLPQLAIWQAGDDAILSEAARWATEMIRTSAKPVEDKEEQGSASIG